MLNRIAWRAPNLPTDRVVYCTVVLQLAGTNPRPSYSSFTYRPTGRIWIDIFITSVSDGGNVCVGRAMVQAVSRWSLSAAARVRNKAGPRGILWWKLRLQDGVFSEYFGFHPAIIPQPVLHNHSFIHH